MAILGITTLRLAIDRSSAIKWALIAFFSYMGISYAILALFSAFASWVQITVSFGVVVGVYIFFEAIERILIQLKNWLYPRSADSEAAYDSENDTPLLLVATNEDCSSDEGMPRRTVSNPLRSATVEAKLDRVLQVLQKYDPNLHSGFTNNNTMDTMKAGKVIDSTTTTAAASAVTAVVLGGGSSSKGKSKAKGQKQQQKALTPTSVRCID